MEVARRVNEGRAKFRTRERTAAAPNVQRICDILNFRPPKTRKRMYGDPRTGLDYETLLECSEELRELMDSWLAAACRIDLWPLRERLENDLNRRRVRLFRDPSSVDQSFSCWV